MKDKRGFLISRDYEGGPINLHLHVNGKFYHMPIKPMLAKKIAKNLGLIEKVETEIECLKGHIYFEVDESEDNDKELLNEHYQDHPDYLQAENLIHNQNAKFK